MRRFRTCKRCSVVDSKVLSAPVSDWCEAPSIQRDRLYRQHLKVRRPSHIAICKSLTSPESDRSGSGFERPSIGRRAIIVPENLDHYPGACFYTNLSVMIAASRWYLSLNVTPRIVIPGRPPRVRALRGPRTGSGPGPESKNTSLSK